MRRTRFLFTLCFGLLPLSLATAGTLPVSNLVVFGDSLSDDGNAYIASGGLFPGPNYAGGEFTDGTNTTPATNGPLGLWIDQFAIKSSLGVPTPALAGGSDFAVASATTGSNGLFDVGDQVAGYLKLTSDKASAASLYTFWGGANDLEAGASGKTAADNIASYIQALAKAGGKNFLWLDLPPLGDTPYAMAANSKIPGTSATLNAQAAAFNAEWQIDLYKLNGAGANVIGVDVNSLFAIIQADYQAGCTPGPGSPYCFANITTPAQGQAGVNPNTYLYWDDQHPTTAGHGLVADLAFADFQAVPEPASAGIVLVSLGAGALLLAWRRNRLGGLKN